MKSFDAWTDFAAVLLFCASPSLPPRSNLRGRLSREGMRKLAQTAGSVTVKERFHPGSRALTLHLPPVFLMGFLLFGHAANLPAQQQAVERVYKPNTADEDWSFLRDQSKRIDFWDPLKYIPLGREDRFLTLSGEIRYRPEGFRIRGTETRPATRDSYFLQRYLFGADLHLSRRFRFYTEVQSGIISGRLNSPRPTDKNLVDLHQGFFEWRRALSAQRLIGFKVGRQELEIGSSRLISASPGLNVKRSFDGAVFYYIGPSWRLSGAFAKLVSQKPGEFDDVPDHEQTFWGLGASRKSPGFGRGELGFYYLYVDRSHAVYYQAEGRDQRQTAGVKWGGAGARTDLNYDAIFQWGAFRGAAIRAWAFSTDTGYRFIGAPWKPRLSLRADIASGDRDPQDPRLQSFNPLFPGNSYAGNVGLLGPTNLIDFTPAATFFVNNALIVGFEAPSYWRTSTSDGAYAPDLRLLLPASIGQGRYLGTNPGILVTWRATRHLVFIGAITRFLTGKFLENTFVASGFGFYSASALYRF